MDQIGGLTNAWTFSAIQHHELSNPALTIRERDVLTHTTAQELIAEVKLLESEHDRQSHSRHYVAKVQVLLKGLDKFGKALDVFANADPHGILSLVWGSLRLVIAVSKRKSREKAVLSDSVIRQVAKDFHDYLDELFGFLAQIGSILGRLEAYEKLLPSSLRLNNALCQVYREFLLFINSAKAVFKDESSRTSLRASMKSKIQKINPWSGFKDNARASIKKIQNLCDEASQEATLAVSQRQDYYLQNITSKLDNQAKIADNTANKEALKDFGQWLAPIAVNDDLHSIRETRMDNSCDWLMQDQEFQSWRECNLQETHRTDPLWISGPPGSGKTYLSSFLVDYFQDLGDTVGYFFCKSEDQTKKSALSVIRTWAWQLFYSLEDVPHRLFEYHAKGGVPSKAALVDCLIQLSSASRSAVLLVDGLDECPLEDQQQLLSVCQQLVKAIKIVVVSRPETHIRMGLQKVLHPGRLTQIRVTEVQTRHSINQFITRGVDSLEILDNMKQKVEVVKELSKGAHGLFLWVRLMLEHLSAQIFVEDVMEALREAPQGLPEMYGRSLDAIDQMPPKHTQIAYRILQWILFALRPLSLDELCTAVGVEPGVSNIRQLQKSENMLLQLCKSLVEIDQLSRTVRLVHASVRDYLLSTNNSRRSIACAIFHPSTGNAHLAGSCLTYLSFDRGHPYDGLTTQANSEQFALFLMEHPLVEYASFAWIVHMARVLEQVNPTPSLSTFGLSPKPVVHWLQVIKALDASPYPGLSVTKDLVDDLLMYQGRGDTRYTWLSHVEQIIASDALKILKYHLCGVRITRWRRFLCRGWWNRKLLPPLAIASYFDFRSLIQDQKISELLSFLSNDRGMEEEYVWSMAARGDAMDTLEYILHGRLLLSGSTQVDKEALNQAHAARFSNALRESLRDDIIDWRTGKPLAITNPFSWTPELLSAAQMGDGAYRAGRRLLEAGADPNLKSLSGNTSLHELAHSQRDGDPEIAIAQMLLDHASDLQSTNAHSQTPLHIAARYNAPHLARLFINHRRKMKGTSSAAELINFRQSGIDTALFHACLVKGSQAATVLIEEGADLKIKSMLNDRSILQVALAGACNVVPLLLEKGVEIQTRDSNGNNALHDAARLDLPDEIELLIRYGSRLNDTNTAGQTPIDIAADHGNEKAIQTLLDFGARITDTNSLVSAASTAGTAILRKIKRNQMWLDHNPKESRDIFHTSWILRRASGDRISANIVGRILDSAEYWLRSSADRNEAMTFDMHNAKEPYLRTPPILGRTDNPVRKISFTITSKDQGWSDFPKDGSWSWWEAWRLNGDGDADKVGPIVCYNIHAGKTLECKRTTWHTNDDPTPADKQGSPLQTADWIASLRPGDSVLLVPCVSFPGWRNIVQDAKIEVFTSALSSPHQSK